VEAKIGENITYNCQTKRHYLTWLFNYKSALPENAIKEGTTLSIRNLRQNNSGLYFCFGERPTFFDEMTTHSDMIFIAIATLKVLGKSIIVLYDTFTQYKLFSYTSWII